MSAVERILEGRVAASAAPERLGGKARNLSALTAEGLPVPAWLVVTTDVYESVRARLAAELDRHLAGLAPEDHAAARAASEAIGRLFAGARLPEADSARLRALAASLFAPGALVAVRSSAVGEDSGADSFAGQLETWLEVPLDRIEERVLGCFASAFSERALLYRKLRGASGVSVAVVVQLMVEPRCAGVLFTANPTTGDRSEAVVAAGLGLGEGVVADKVEADSVFVDLASGAIRRSVIAKKRSRIARDPGGSGTRVEPVPEAEGDRPALSEGEVAALVALGRGVAERRGTPQDLEWAIDAAGKIHLLQTRPITTLGGRTSVFDCSNIVESYPGLSSPLTFSFARAAYEATFREGSRSFGVPERIIEANWHVHANLVALIDGRIYYNLLNFYGLFQLVPGFEGVLPAWEKALGLEPGQVPPRPALSRWQRLALVPLKLRIVWRSLRHFARLSRNVAAFLDRFAGVQKAFRSRPLAGQDTHELLELYEHLARELLAPYAISTVNDFFAQQFHELTGKLIARWALSEDAAALRNDLLCGETGMESVEPVRSILALVERARKDPALRALVETDDRALEVVRRDPRHADFAAALARHLELYGDRTREEPKLETPTAESDPLFVLTLLRSYLRGGQDVGKMERREQEIRSAAEAAVSLRLAGRPIRRALFSFVLGQCRKTVKYRENLRLARSRAFGMVKRIFRQLGEVFAARDLLARADDVFFLTTEEVAGAIRGHGVTRDLKALVALRRREYAGYSSALPPARVITTGAFAASARGTKASPAGTTDGALQGIGCSPGRVTGKAKVVLSAESSLDVRGEILVAPMTDPGWVFLMVAASGIVVERGSPLSHTAIIGRELGIPTVVGVAGATTRIRDGDTIELDGRSGLVTILSAGGSASIP